jgi:hypothetical protein
LVTFARERVSKTQKPVMCTGRTTLSNALAGTVSLSEVLRYVVTCYYVPSFSEGLPLLPSFSEVLPLFSEVLPSLLARLGATVP